MSYYDRYNGRNDNNRRSNNSFRGRGNRNGGRGHFGNRSFNPFNPYNRRNDKFEKRNSEDDKVPIKYQPKKKKSDESTEYATVLCKRNMFDDGIKRKVPIFKDGDDEEFLTTIMRFAKLTTTFDYMLNNQELPNTVESLMECFDGASYNDLQRILETHMPNIDGQTFFNDVWQFIEEHMGDKAVKYQLKYLRKTKMPRDLTAKEWIRRVQAINSLIPHMSRGAENLTDQEIIDEVIEPNLPVYLQHKLELHVTADDTMNDIGDKLATLIADHEQNKNFNRKQREKHKNRRFQGGRGRGQFGRGNNDRNHNDRGRSRERRNHQEHRHTRKRSQESNNSSRYSRSRERGENHRFTRRPRSNSYSPHEMRMMSRRREHARDTSNQSTKKH